MQQKTMTQNYTIRNCKEETRLRPAREGLDVKQKKKKKNKNKKKTKKQKKNNEETVSRKRFALKKTK